MKDMQYQTLVEAVLAHAAAEPDRLAVCFRSERLAYSALTTRMEGLAALLAKRGVCQGDRVMLGAPSTPDFVVALLAAQYLGAVTVPVDRGAVADNVAKLYAQTEPRILLWDGASPGRGIPYESLRGLCAQAAAFADRNLCLPQSGGAGTSGTNSAVCSAPDIPAYIPPDDGGVAEIICTTGTTGMPKCVAHTYGSIRAITRHTWLGTGREAGGVELVPLPLNHSLALRSVRTTLWLGGTVVLQGGFTFMRDLEANLRDCRCTGMVIVPASLEKLLRVFGERFTEVLGVLRHIEVGSGSLTLAMKRRLRELLPGTTVYNTWGTTETGGVIFLDVTHAPESSLDSLGLHEEDVAVRLMGGDNPADSRYRVAGRYREVGRLAVRGDMVMHGYWGRPDLTAAALSDGWLVTSDLARFAEDGSVRMLGRADDIINTGGEKVSPVEVEDAASLFPGMAECACAGADARDGMGQVPVLFVVMESGLPDEKALLRFLSARLEQYKLPRRVIPLDALPRNAMQKVDRGLLRELAHLLAAPRTSYVAQE